MAVRAHHRAWQRRPLRESKQASCRALDTARTQAPRGAIRDAVLFLKGDMNIESMLEAFDLWFEASHIPFRHIKNHKTDRYVVQHGLGKKWSIYITAVVNSLLNEIEYKVVNQTSHEQSVSFDIVKI